MPACSEIIRFDYGGTFGPWMSDVARTYHAVWEAEEDSALVTEDGMRRRLRRVGINDRRYEPAFP